MKIFFKDTDKMPELPTNLAAVYQLAGQSPEYEATKKLRIGPGHLHGCRIVRRGTVPESVVTAARELLANLNTYGDRSIAARCYSPGLAFTFGDGAEAVDVLVCLDCRWVVFHFGGQSVSLAPTDDGLARLREIYQAVIKKESTPEA